MPTGRTRYNAVSWWWCLDVPNVHNTFTPKTKVCRRGGRRILRRLVRGVGTSTIHTSTSNCRRCYGLSRPERDAITCVTCTILVRIVHCMAWFFTYVVHHTRMYTCTPKKCSPNETFLPCIIHIRMYGIPLVTCTCQLVRTIYSSASRRLDPFGRISVVVADPTRHDAPLKCICTYVSSAWRRNSFRPPQTVSEIYKSPQVKSPPRSTGKYLHTYSYIPAA